jgi:oligopeptidase A
MYYYYPGRTSGSEASVGMYYYYPLTASRQKKCLFREICQFMFGGFFLACVVCGSSEESEHPFLVDTRFVDWQTLSPSNVEADVRMAISLGRSVIDSIVSTPDESVTFENTIVALEYATVPLQRAWSRVLHLDRVLNSPELRIECHKMIPEVSFFQSSLFLNESLWQKVKVFANSEGAGMLSPIDARLLNETVESFREMGADLLEESRGRLKEIAVALDEQAQRFRDNCLDSRNAWELYVEDYTELAGVPPGIVDRLAAAAKQHNHTGFRLSLDMSVYQPLMEYLKSDSLRRQLYDGFLAIGRSDEHNNTAIVGQILALRHERAALLGFSNHADAVLKRRMAKNGTAAIRFIERLHKKSRAFFKSDVRDLRAFAADNNGTLAPWNLAYYSRLLTEKKSGYDPELLRPYFNAETVMSGLFDLAHKLFRVKITPCQTFASDDFTVPVWDPAVRVYDLFDEDGAYVGSFYADLYPRASKMGGAWMMPIGLGGLAPDGSWTAPLAVVCGSLSPPTETMPALLTLKEVSTIFHEFGHALHHLFGRVKWPSLNGANVVWDFVELPSQLFENFCRARESLDPFAKHFESGDRIPDELWEKVEATRTALSGIAMMRQLFLARLDLELHYNYEAYAEGQIEGKLKKALAKYRIDYGIEEATDVMRFEHLFGGGYDAAYYSYKWAEVLDADAFTKFEKAGVVSTEVGIEWRDKVLSKGKSEDPDQLYRDFMGRDPKLKALLVRSGFIAEKKKKS